MSYQHCAGSPTRGRFVAVVAMVATLGAGLFVALAPATAAQADPTVTVYCEEHRLPDGRRIVPCWHIDDVWRVLRPTPDPCLSCPPYALQFWESIVLPDPVAQLVAQGIFDGRHNLLLALLAENPQERQAYRNAAWTSYRTAAANLGQASLAVGAVLIHYKDGMGDPDPEPNLFKQYGGETIQGLGLLRAALAKPPNAGQLEQQARAAFDRAAAAFVQAVQTG